VLTLENPSQKNLTFGQPISQAFGMIFKIMVVFYSKKVG